MGRGGGESGTELGGDGEGAEAERTRGSEVFTTPLAYQYWSKADTPVMRHAKMILELLEGMDGVNEVSLAWPVVCNGEEQVRSLEWLSKTPRVWESED